MFEKLNSKQVDLLNIGLILISLLIAIELPFKLFLFSYAVLGPLHYLTEINWLQQKNFFIPNPKKWILPLVVLTILLSIYPIVLLSQIEYPNSYESGLNFLAQNSSTFILAGFLFAVFLIFVKGLKKMLIGLCLSILFSFILNHLIPKYFIFVGIFIPTIIHVYLFTGLFMLYGARKGKSKPGIIGVLVLACIPFIIAFLNLDITDYRISEETLSTFMSSNMISVNASLFKMFKLNPSENFQLLSLIGFKIQIFISFAYTYHYLNWFSKTSIIGWKQSLNKKKTISIVMLWLVSIALYYYDYKTGFIALFFLSFLHVFLEFPLNVVSIKGIFSKN